MMKPVHLIVLAALFVFNCSVLVSVSEAKSDHYHNPYHQQQQQNDKLRAQSRSSDSNALKKASENKAVVDMHSVYQQHLVGPNVASAVAPHETPKNEKKDIWSRFGSKEANAVEGSGKKGKLQTVGSVIGDIIGVLVSEIARFFGSVVSDVAREVTAHGFVSLFKQIADLTGISGGHGHGANTATTATGSLLS